jgi:protein TonB
MAYADQPRMSNSRIAAIVIVAILHALLGYAFVTGLAYNVVKKVAEDLKTFDVEEEKPPPEEPPPPPKDIPETPPPVVSPPPLVRTNAPPPPMVTTNIAPPPIITPTAPPAPPPAPPAPPPPPPPRKVTPARAKADLPGLFSTDDYPPSALRAGEAGTTGYHLEIGPNGRVTNCSVTSSSGSSALDTTTCRLLRSRARFTPATDSTGSATSDTYNGRIRWVLPPD